MRTIVILCVALSGCGVETSGDGFGFGNTATPPVTTTAGGTSPAESSSEAGSSEEDDDGDASSSSSTSPSDATTGEGTTVGEPPDAGDTTGAPPQGGGQPAAGMYSPCIDAGVCAPLTVCMQILDAMMMPTDGFCTALGCTDPSTQCTAAPGGSATPSCYAVVASGMPDAVCALDCSGGKTCPTGMVCQNLTGGMVCV